ncbi:hypothetical protein M758_12G096100, partial [Ceratodon purpureus]
KNRVSSALSIALRNRHSPAHDSSPRYCTLSDKLFDKKNKTEHSKPSTKKISQSRSIGKKVHQTVRSNSLQTCIHLEQEKLFLRRNDDITQAKRSPTKSSS